MATAAATRPSGPVLSIPNYGSASPNRIKLAPARSPAKSSISVSSSPPPASSTVAAKSRRSCMCSPTNHPGSFRCSLHKDRKQETPASHGHAKPASPPSPPPSNIASTPGSGARILARRAIAPSQQSQSRRRVAAAGPFRPRPSRFSAGDCAGDNRQ